MQTFVESEAIKLTPTYLKNPSLALVTKSQRNVNIRVARPAVLDTVAVKVKPTGLLCACAHEITYSLGGGRDGDATGSSFRGSVSNRESSAPVALVSFLVYIRSYGRA